MNEKIQMTTLFSLAEEVRRCTACPLWKTRTLAVPGEGPAKANVMFIGEAPGREEDRQGLPFAGRSGKFLDGLLQDIDLPREKVFITGAVKCHPPGSRVPVAHELKTCKKLWLEKQIELIQPTVIVILGRIALRSLLGETNVSDLHGRVIKQKEQKYFVTFHPAAAMRFPKIKKLMQNDFKRLQKLV